MTPRLVRADWRIGMQTDCLVDRRWRQLGYGHTQAIGTKFEVLENKLGTERPFSKGDSRFTLLRPVLS